jgi:predicted nucleic acid-binding protein
MSIIESLEVEVSPDPDDNYLLELVIASVSDFLVSVDQHLLGLGPGGPFHVVSPQQFLSAIR